MVQQCHLEPVSLHLCSTSCEVASPQSWLPLWLQNGSQLQLRLNSSLFMSSRRESFVKFLLQNQSVALPGFLLQISLTQSGSVPSPVTCSLARGWGMLAGSQQSGPTPGSWRVNPCKQLCPEGLKVSKGKEGAERRWPLSLVSLSNHLFGYE